MQADLLHLYGECDCCATESFTMASADEEAINQLAALAAKEAERIWKLKSMPEKINPILTQAYASIYMDGVKEGYGVDLSQIDYDTPDAEMLKNLTNNVYSFSAAKNYTQMRQLTQAIVGGDGKIRSYSEFKKAAFTINQEHTLNWLNAEYETAIGSAQMASKWVEIQRSKDSIPLLQFDAVMDSRTSPICRPLDLVIKPADDPFWNTYYPPNHYRCRSSVKQLRTGKVTPNHDVVHPEKGIPDMFKTNLAKTGVIFPPGHAYWEGVPETVIKQGQSVLQNDIEKWSKENLRNRKFEASKIGEVEFTGASIEELLHKGHYDKQAKNLCLFDMENILKKAQLVQISPDGKGNWNVKQWYYLKFNIGGKPSYINVREMIDGKKTVYAITDHLK